MPIDICLMLYPYDKYGGGGGRFIGIVVSGSLRLMFVVKILTLFISHGISKTGISALSMHSNSEQAASPYEQDYVGSGRLQCYLDS